MTSTTIRVEFFGVPRQRAGATEATLLRGEMHTLGDALRELAARFPQLVSECLEADGRLKPGYMVSLDGRQFARDPQTPLAEVESILLLSADAGG